MGASGLFLLFWKETKGQLALLVVTLVATPLMIAYLDARLADTPRAAWQLASLALAVALMAPVSHVGFSILDDRFDRRIVLLRSLPVSKRSYLAARLTVPTLAAAALVVGAVAAAGQLSVRTFAGTLWTATALPLSLAALGAWVAARVRDPDGAWALVSIVALGLGLVSPIVYPLESLPPVLRELMWLSPYTHLRPQLDAALGGTAFPLAHALASTALACLLLLLTRRDFEW